MKLELFIFLSILFVSTNAFDFIRYALNQINTFGDPCDDFYRHACPEGRYGHLASENLDPLIEEVTYKQRNNAWEKLEITKVLTEINDGEIEASMDNYIINSFQEMCKNNAPEKENYLLRIQQMLTQSLSTSCSSMACLAPLAKDENCTRVTEILQERLRYSSLRPNFMVVDVLRGKTEICLRNIRAVNVILDMNLQNGVEQVNSFTKEMIDVLSDWVESTPWAKEYGVRGTIQQIAKEIHLAENFAVQLKDNIEPLMKIEKMFLKCSQEFSKQQDFFCLTFVANLYEMPRTPRHIFSLFNAAYSHPVTVMGSQLYTIATNADALAGTLGLVGAIAGHEIGHAVIEDPKKLELFPIYSTEAIECIQNQYNRTCQEFIEESCDVTDSQIDENGADVLGIQLAYKLFEKYYGDSKRDEYVKIHNKTITYQQLFFYASAFGHCNGRPSASHDGVHSASNVRSNAVANHPAFQEAFQCASDSRMMSTVEKQCLVYGEKAPQTRKKFQRKHQLERSH